MTLLCVARCRPDTPREAAPGYRLCWPCRDWLGRNYAQLADLAPDLEAALSKANIVGEKVGGSPTHAAELNDAAAAARWQIHHDMVTTVRLVMDIRGLTGPPKDNIEAMAHWLARHVNWLAAHPSAAERSAEVQDWVSAAKNAINPNPPKRVQIGPCVIPDCPGELSAVVRPQDSLLPSMVICSFWDILADEGRKQIIEDGGEPHTWTADRWHTLRRRMVNGVIIDTATLAELTGFGVRQIQRFAKDGVIEPMQVRLGLNGRPTMWFDRVASVAKLDALPADVVN